MRLFRNYKKIIILILVLLSAVIFWFFGCRRQNRTATKTTVWERQELSDADGCRYHFETAYLEGEMTFGTQGYLTADRTLPVTATLTCTEESFAGTLKITLPGGDGKGVAYQSALSCKKGVTGKLRMKVPELGNASYFYVEILDQMGASVLSELVINDAAGETADDGASQTLYLGVLGSGTEALSYLEEAAPEIGGAACRVKLVRLSADSFPKDADALASLDGILVDDFDLSTLSQTQVQCLQSWVSENAGRLLLTGDVTDTDGRSGLAQTLGVSLASTTDDGKKIHFYDEDGESIGSVRLSCADPAFSAADWTEGKSASPAAFAARQYGKGYVTLLYFCLRDDALLQWTGKNQVSKAILQEMFQNYGEDGEELGLWYIKKALYAFMDSQMPDTFYYGVFFICYLAALAFFAYYMLRKIRRREYIWGVVPLIAVAFTLVLLLRSRGLSSADSSLSALRVVDEGSGEDTVYLLYQNTERENASVSMAEEVTAVSPVYYEYQTGTVDDAYTWGIGADYTVNDAKNGYEIDFEEAVPGTERLLQFTLKSTASAEASFAQEIACGYASFSGNVTNRSGVDYDRVAVIRGNQYVILDGMKAGETKTIDGADVSCWNGYREEAGLSGEEENSVAGNLLGYLRQEFLSGTADPQELVIVGVTSGDPVELFSDGTEIKNHVTVRISRFALPETEEEYVADINRENIEDGDEYGSLQSDILEAAETEATYRFDSSKVVWALIRNRDDFQGTIYAYNHETDEMDAILNEWDEVMYCEALEPYLTDMNRITLRYVMADGTEYGGAPVLSLVLKDVGTTADSAAHQ